MSVDVVHVACKLPNGLQLGELRINGTAYDRADPQNAPQTFGGYVLTLNVPFDTWSNWIMDNGQSTMVQRHLIFADANLAQLKNRAKSLSSVSTVAQPVGNLKENETWQR